MAHAIQTGRRIPVQLTPGIVLFSDVSVSAQVGILFLWLCEASKKTRKITIFFENFSKVGGGNRKKWGWWVSAGWAWDHQKWGGGSECGVGVNPAPTPQKSQLRVPLVAVIVVIILKIN